MYEKEIALTFAPLQTRAMAVRREAWERYLAFVKQKYQRDQILKDMETVLPVAESRGAGRKKSNPNEIFGSELPPKTLVLTFDDGPHPRYTDQILEILTKYHIRGVFFEVGRNLGTLGANDEIRLTPNAAASYRILAEGSAIANHSYSHALLPKLDEPGYSQEIESTDRLLKFILKADPTMFRAPYGARNDGIMSVVEAKHLKSIMWNIDSMDWADPVPKSITQRVLGEIAREGRGIILFHDIHKRALEVLPSLIETLQAEDYRFAAWNGSSFATSETRGGPVASAPAPIEAPYRESWAAIVGIDNYQSWPKLRYAANDAQGVRELLVQKYQFKPQNVFLLLNQEATRQSILSLLGDKLANPDLVKHDDRVFIFFAGHGATRKLPSGRELGYIIPVDAGVSEYQGQAISMTNFQDIAEAIPAKHVLFVMDSCYSGLALTRGGSVPVSQNYLREISRREARQMFTAGGADQQVADNGPNGHSVFTWTLLQALDGRGDLNGDGVITATEIAAYVAPAVSSLSRQTPAFGNLAGSEGGDFIFDLKHESEFLSSTSAQLGDDAIRLNTEVERLRAENLQIRQELAAAQSMLQQKKPQGSRAGPVADRALALNDDGMRLYKERKYAEAAAKFTAAAGLDPKSALFANNAGFAVYRMERYEDAVRWYDRAIALDPNRAVAYVNLGDAYLQLKRDGQAKQAFEKYLLLAPAGKSAAYVREKLKALAP
jgi:peptidoglycan/xylan/chitin deacetylase (PgdA/CDA1 family)/tetratricopeptide (TPR) repeat protein